MREAMVFVLGIMTLSVAAASSLAVPSGDQGAVDQSGPSDSIKQCVDITSNPGAWTGKTVSLIGQIEGVQMEYKLPREVLNRRIERNAESGAVVLDVPLPKPNERENYVVMRRFVCWVDDQGQRLLFVTDKGSTVQGPAPAPPPVAGRLWKVTGTVAKPQKLEVTDSSGKTVKRKVPYLVDAKFEPITVKKQ